MLLLTTERYTKLCHIWLCKDSNLPHRQLGFEGLLRANQDEVETMATLPTVTVP